MEHNLNFEFLSIRFGLYSGYNLDNIQQEHLKSASLELCYLEQHYHGLHHCWKKTLTFLKIWMTFLLNSMTHLVKLTEFERLQQSFDLYARDLVQLQFMLQISAN
jgi:hypothetical protein